jgi:hypothetical protein
MGREFSIMDRLSLAFEVMTRWETMATLGVFIVFWLIVRYVADPWRSEGRRPSLGFRKRADKDSVLPPVEAVSEDDLDGDDLPD